MSSGPAPFYKVVYSEAVRRTLQILGERAKQLGVGAEFASALRILDGRLRADPLGVGEPRRFLQDLHIHVRVGGIPYFYFRFGVDEDRRLVYVIGCTPSARLE